MADEEDLSVVLNLRITPADLAELKAQTPGGLPRSFVARAALRLGLEVIRRDPAALVRAGTPKPGEKPQE